MLVPEDMNPLGQGVDIEGVFLSDSRFWDARGQIKPALVCVEEGENAQKGQDIRLVSCFSGFIPSLPIKSKERLSEMSS